MVAKESAWFCELGNRVYTVAEKISASALRAYGAIPVKTSARRFGSKIAKRLHFAEQVDQLIEQYRPDLVIGHGDIFRQHLNFMHNCVHLAHERIPGAKLNDVAAIHERILRQQHFDLLIANSRMMQQDLQQRFAIAKTKTRVLYPSFDAAHFFPQPLDLSLRQRLKLPTKSTLLGLITSGNYRKRNLDLLLTTLAYAQQRGQDKLYLLVSGQECSAHYRRCAARLGIARKVLFVPAIDAVEDYYHTIDIFVLPAFVEEFGRSALEAAACGKPVICSAYVGAVEVLKDSALIIDINADDAPKKLLTMILQLQQNPESSHERGLRCATAAQDYNDKAMLDSYQQILLEERHKPDGQNHYNSGN